MAATATTIRDLTGFLSGIAAVQNEVPRLSDFYEHLAEKNPRRARVMERNAEYFLGMRRDGAVSKAIDEVTRFLARERKKGEQGHWSYDMNRVIALREMLADLAEYEAAVL